MNGDIHPFPVPFMSKGVPERREKRELDRHGFALTTYCLNQRTDVFGVTDGVFSIVFPATREFTNLQI